MGDHRKYFYVAFFGALGAGVRYLITFFVDGSRFPLPTLIANLLGCLALGILVGVISLREFRNANLVIGLKAGFLGSFTTFSSFCFEGFHLGSSGHYLLAFFYMTVSLVFGMFLGGWGLSLGEGLANKMAEREGLC